MQFALGFLGILLYALFKVKDHLSRFDLSKFVNENKAFWIWSLSMVIVLLIIVNLAPDAGDAIKAMTGLDVANTLTSFLSLGWALSILANQVTRNPIGVKPRGETVPPGNPPPGKDPDK